MKTKRLTVSFACAALLAGGLAVGGEIYKWVDDEGNVHYEDRPIGAGSIERMGIASRNTDEAAVQARVDARREARALADQVAAEAPPEMSKEEIRKEREERAAKCQEYRDRLEEFLASQRLYREDETGERNYLSDEEVSAAHARVEQQIKEYCGS